METQSGSRSGVTPPALRRAVLETALSGGAGAALLAAGYEIGDKHPVPQALLVGLGVLSVGYGVVRALWFLLNVIYRLGRSWSQAVLRRVAPPGINEVVIAGGVASEQHIRYGGRIVRTAALLLPREHRAHWAQDVVATMNECGTSRLAKLATVLNQASTFPWQVVQSWVEKLNATSITVSGMRVDLWQLFQDFWTAVASGLTSMKASTTRWWREWWIALLFALLAAILMEPVMHITGYLLHHHELVWPWEKWFPES